jgi:hypothetical protein
VLLVAALASAGCRRQVASDHLALVPGDAQLLVELDLAALRAAAATAGLLEGARGSAAAQLGLDPRRDLDKVLLGAGSGARGQLDFIVLLAGRIDEPRVLRAMRAQSRPLEEQRRRGWRLHAAPRGEGFLVFPRPGLLAVVSAGWLERLLDRLDGRGPALTDRSALARRIGPLRGRGRAAWAVCLLAPASGRLAARRLGWAELGQLAAVQASVEAAAAGVVLQGAAELRDAAAARALDARLRRLLRERQLAGELRLVDRELRLRLSVSGGELRGLFGPEP